MVGVSNKNSTKHENPAKKPPNLPRALEAYSEAPHA